MALQKCDECGKDVSSKASACPNCGAPVAEVPVGESEWKETPNTPIAKIVFFIAVIGFFIAIAMSDSDTKSTGRMTEAPKTEAQLRTELLQGQFSGWDGSHRGLERMIKAAMNDPDSYEHDETRYGDYGDHLVVHTKYRGKNAFGGVVRSWAKAKVDLDGNVLEVIDEGP